MFDTLSRSWEIAKQSVRVLQDHPKLAIFPVLSSIACFIASIPFLAPLIYLGVQGATEKGSTVPQAAFMVLGFLSYFVTYAVGIFFNAALVTCVSRVLRGESADLSDGLTNAWAHIKPILGWAAIGATVGQILKQVQENGGIVGSIIGGILGFAWNLAIFFVVPIVVLEGKDPITALKESASRLQRTWGEQIVLNGGMGLVSFIFVALPILGMVGLMVVAFVNQAMALGFFALAMAIIYGIVSAIVISTLTVVYQTALYSYTATGQAPLGYSQDLLGDAFRVKARR